MQQPYARGWAARVGAVGAVGARHGLRLRLLLGQRIVTVGGQRQAWVWLVAAVGVVGSLAALVGCGVVVGEAVESQVGAQQALRVLGRGSTIRERRWVVLKPVEEVVSHHVAT